jgi:hypothetical protein
MSEELRAKLMAANRERIMALPDTLPAGNVQRCANGAQPRLAYARARSIHAIAFRGSLRSRPRAARTAAASDALANLGCLGKIWYRESLQKSLSYKLKGWRRISFFY